MNTMIDEALDKKLQAMWEAHRDYLRRLLIALSKDIDLADDLLQETYLKARAGFEGYRGGDARAWLAAIARNTFHSHLRRRYVWCESSLEEDDLLVLEPMDHGLDLIEIRRALADLPKPQRDALVMKHYGGYAYEDIAAHMGCPVGTAKSRVNQAIKRLRLALAASREELNEVKCADLSERTLLDFIYRRTPGPERKRIAEHLAGCASCRARVQEIGSVLLALDTVECECRGTSILELHEDGTVTDFMFGTWRNTGETRKTLDAGGDIESISSVLVNGEEAAIEPIPGEESRKARLRLAHPLASGQRVELLMTGRSVTEQTKQHTALGLLSSGPGKLVFDTETLFVMAVRLPQRASLVKATPEPSDVRSNNATTVLWRKVHQPNEVFEFSVEYRL